MAVNTIANTASRVVGPVLAGVLLAWAVSGATGAYAAMALCYFVSSITVAWLPRSVVRSGARDRHVFADVGDGLRYVWQQPRLRLLVVFFVGIILIGFPHVILLPGLLENQLARPATDVSQLYFCSAVGALASSVGIARFADSPWAMWIYAALAVAFGAGLVGLAWVPSFATAAVAAFVLGVTNGGFQALNAALLARECEPAYIGRVMSLTLMAFAGFGLMALPLGALADLVGERHTLAGMGVAVIAISVAMSVGLRKQFV